MPLPSGSQLGPYTIASPLGAGGMGEVYRARDSRLGRDVAIKVLRPRWRGDGHELFYAAPVNTAVPTPLPVTVVSDWTSALNR